MKTMPTRIDGELFEAAKAAGQVHSRSAAQQLDYWARIGRELEASPAISGGDVERVLAGHLRYDDASDHVQAAVRAAWGDDIAERVASLDFTDQFQAAGRPWAEADEDGNLVVREPSADTA